MDKFPALITLEAARKAPLPPGRRSPEMLRHGSLEVRFYAPRGSDPQTPHDRDEVERTGDAVHLGDARDLQQVLSQRADAARFGVDQDERGDHSRDVP